MDNEQRVKEFQKLQFRLDALETRIWEMREEMRAFVERGEQDRETAERLEEEMNGCHEQRSRIWARLAEIDPVATADLN